MRSVAPLLRLGAVALLVLPLFLSAARAQTPGAETGSPYRLGPGDVVQLSVWQQPELDRQLRVRSDGTVVVPLVGEIQAAGETIPDLEALLTRRLRSFNRDITEVSLTVVAYNSFEVFVMGAVSSPGQYTFDTHPNVWDALRAAGGPLPTANLNRVRILRQLEAGTSTLVVNVSAVVSGQSPARDIPELQAGDTIIVPDVQNLSALDRESGVHVMGAVTTPGFYPVEEPTPLLTVVLQAGGFGDGADLSQVRWVQPTPEGPLRARRVDVRLFLENGQAESNPMIQAGDTVYVERRASAYNYLNWLTAGTGLAALMVSLLRN